MIAHIDPTAGRAKAAAATTSTMTLGEIERLTALLADHTNALDDTLAEYERELQAVNDKFMRPLKRQAAATATAEAELHQAIESAPELFAKPRTITLHGFKIGYTVSQGKLVFDDEELVIKLLRKKFPEMTDALINRTEKVNKDGVKALALEEDDLKKLGLRTEDKGDMVHISRAAGDIEKLLGRLKTKLVEAIVASE